VLDTGFVSLLIASKSLHTDSRISNRGPLIHRPLTQISAKHCTLIPEPLTLNRETGAKGEVSRIQGTGYGIQDGGAGNAETIPDENVGFLGENNLGNKRFLTKPVWENPHPDKTISHIDLNSGLIKMAPFIVAITIE
jgi:hypothetical protein